MRFHIFLHNVIHGADICWSGCLFSLHNLQINCLLDYVECELLL